MGEGERSLLQMVCAEASASSVEPGLLRDMRETLRSSYAMLLLAADSREGLGGW